MGISLDRRRASRILLAGGDAWARWDDKISRNLTKVQNTDGSWTGHHCITGRTFCTSAALLVLMVDRTLMPPEAIAKARTVPEPEPEPEP